MTRQKVLTMTMNRFINYTPVISATIPLEDGLACCFISGKDRHYERLQNSSLLSNLSSSSPTTTAAAAALHFLLCFRW